MNASKRGTATDEINAMTGRSYDDGYAAGLVAGRILSLENFAKRCDKVLEKYDDRLTRIDRLVWIGLGILITLEALPHIGRLIDMVAPAKAAAAVEHCFPVEQFARAFQVVFPSAPQERLAGDDARHYLTLYNSFPPQTVYNGDSLLFIVLRTPRVIMVPLVEGVGCRRVVVTKVLHRQLLRRVDRSKI